MSYTILALDDSDFLVEVVAMNFKNQGYKVITAHDGNQGIQKFNENQIDLIITDLNMPSLDGLGFVKKIREINSSIPILIMTVELTKQLERELKSLGIKHFFIKPFNPLQLNSLIKEILTSKISK